MFLIGQTELLMGDKLPGVGVGGCVVRASSRRPTCMHSCGRHCLEDQTADSGFLESAEVG